MTNYTGTVYGVGDSRKGGFKTTAALTNEMGNPGKGQKSMRFVVAVGSQISGGEIFVNNDTVIVANDTLTLTVTAG